MTPSLPPEIRGPRGLPFFGSLFAWQKNPAAFFLKAREDYGDLVPFKMGFHKAYLVSRPEWIRDILVTHQHNFIKGAGLQWAKEFLGEGLLTSEAPLHTRQRRLAQPAFHRQRIASYGEIMVALSAKRRERWRDGERLDLAHEMMALTLAIAGKTLFDAEVEEEAEGIGAALKALMAAFLDFASPVAALTRRLPLPRNNRLQEAKETIDRTIYRIIEARRKDGSDHGDLLSMLMEAQDEDGSRMSDTQLRDECVTIFLAGHETTANALAWTFYALSQNPKAEAVLHAELDSVLGSRLPEVGDLKKLPYTEAVLTESMRLYPPAWGMARRNKETYEIEGLSAPPMSSFVMSPYVVQRDPRWYKDPLAFRPERWTDAFKASLPPFAYFSFGGGARKCIGEGFAWMEGELLIATIAQRFRFELTPDARVEPQALITLRPRYGLPVFARAR